MCSKKKINLWNIKSRGSKTITANVSVKGFRHLKPICRATSSSIHIFSKKGLPFLSVRLSKRTGLIIGFAAFLFSIIWLCSHIWYIDITAETTIPHDELISQLEVAGITKGTPIRDIDPKKVQATLLNLNPRLSWAWPNIKGTGVFLDVRERVLTPEILPTDKPCNVVATHAGQIYSAVVKEGRSMVETDMYVSKGQLLVSGLMDSNAVGVRYVHSDAEIWAHTEESVSETFFLERSSLATSGNASFKYTLRIGNIRLSTPLIGDRFDFYELYSEETAFHIGNIYFPVSVIKTTYSEIITETEYLSEEELIDEAKQYLENLLQNSLNNGMIIEKVFDIQKLDEKTFGITLNALCNRQIAQKEPIEEEHRIGENN